MGIDKPGPAGGVRPIAVCSTLSRWLSRTLLAAFHVDIQQLTGFNLGVACPAGREAATLAIALDMHRHPERHTLAVDLSNAFNTPSRRWLVQATRALVPGLAPSVARLLLPKGSLALNSSCYDGGITSEEDAVTRGFLESASGTRQGDPLSPLIFSMVMHFAIARISAEAELAEESALSVAYLDDWTIRASARAIDRVVDSARVVLPQFGMQMNMTKSKILVPTQGGRGEGDDREQRRGDGWPEVVRDGLPILGTPLGSDEYVEQKLAAEVVALRRKGEALTLYAQSAPQSNRPRAAMAMLRSCFAHKVMHLARTVPPRLFKPVALAFDEVIADITLSLLDEGEKHRLATVPPRHRVEYARTMVFRSIERGGLGVLSAASCAEGAYTASLLQCLPIWRILSRKGMSIGRIPPRLLQHEVTTDAEATALAQPAGEPDERDPLGPLSPPAWSRWSTMIPAGPDYVDVDVVPDAPSMVAGRQPPGDLADGDDDDTGSLTSAMLVRFRVDQVLRRAFGRKLPTTLQRLLVALTTMQRDAAYDDTLRERAERTTGARTDGVGWAFHPEPNDRLVWLLHKDHCGKGHEWVLDAGYRLDPFGNARKGNILLHSDAPVPGSLWVTLMRARLILPLGQVFRSAQRAAGLEEGNPSKRPVCGCSHCADTRHPQGDPKRLLDVYGMHLASVVANYTRRHHRFGEVVARVARMAGWSVTQENLPFVTNAAHHALPPEVKRRRVDHRFECMSVDEVKRVDATAITDAVVQATAGQPLPDRTAVHVLTDHTFHHPGAYLGKIHQQDLRAPDVAADKLVIEGKVAKYRAAADAMTGLSPALPPLVFIPAPLSVYGRQNATTRRLLRLIVSTAAARTAGSPLAPGVDGALHDQRTLQRSARSLHRTMCTISSTVASELARGMFDAALKARSPPTPDARRPHAAAQEPRGAAAPASPAPVARQAAEHLDDLEANAAASPLPPVHPDMLALEAHLPPVELPNPPVPFLPGGAHGLNQPVPPYPGMN